MPSRSSNRAGSRRLVLIVGPPRCRPRSPDSRSGRHTTPSRGPRCLWWPSARPGGLGLLSVTASTSPASLAVFLVLWAIGSGGSALLPALLLSATYGSRHLGSLLAFTEVTGAAGTLSGPIISGVLFDATGSYTIAFTAAALTFVFAGFAFGAFISMTRRIAAAPTATIAPPDRRTCGPATAVAAHSDGDSGEHGASSPPGACGRVRSRDARGYGDYGALVVRGAGTRGALGAGPRGRGRRTVAAWHNEAAGATLRFTPPTAGGIVVTRRAKRRRRMAAWGGHRWLRGSG